MVRSVIGKVLVARNDRLGDWVLTLPLIRAIREALPSARVDAMAQDALAPFLREYGGVDDVVLTPFGRGLGGLREATAAIRGRRYDAAVIVHPNVAETAAVWLAGVPRRVGNGYRGYAVLYNRPVFFHRAPSTSHEVEYNLRLLEGLGLPAIPASDPVLRPTPRDAERGRELLAAAGMEERAYAVIHPGCGGSSLNWSPPRYRALVLEIARSTGCGIVVTGGRGEEELGRYVAAEGEGRVSVAGKTDLGTLIGILAGARLFISGNTGPMHIAAALGTPTLAFFSPLRSGAPTRWGPRGNKAKVLVPPGLKCERCPRMRCEHYNCMEAITVEEALAAARALLRDGNGP